MKTLLVLIILAFSLKTFAGEVGEDQKSPCPYADQSAKRDAKPVATTDDSIKDNAPATISK